MLRLLFFLSISYYLIPMELEAEYFGYLRHPLDGTFNLLYLISSEAYIPQTYYKKHDYNLYVKPIYFNVSKVFHSEEGLGGGADVRANNLGGTGLSFSGAYALNNRFELYSIFNGVRMKGEEIIRYPGWSTVDNVRMNGKVSALSFDFGGAYNLFSSTSSHSFLLVLGSNITRGQIDMKGTPITTGDVYTDIKSDSINFGITTGFQGSVKTENWEFFAYFLQRNLFNKSKVTITVTDANNNSQFHAGQTEDLEVENTFFPTMGFNIKYLPWHLGINLMGLIASAYSSKLYDGLKLRIFSIDYSWGGSDSK